jgi:hypothetical protein
MQNKCNAKAMQNKCNTKAMQKQCKINVHPAKRKSLIYKGFLGGKNFLE